jgi:hypothetical protein
MSHIATYCSDYEITGFAIAFSVGVASGLVATELSKNDNFFRAIIRLGLEKMPNPECRAYERLWMAHLEAIPGPVEKFVHAVACLIQGGLMIGPKLRLQRLPSQAAQSFRKLAAPVRSLPGRLPDLWNRACSRVVELLANALGLALIGGLLWLAVTFGVPAAIGGMVVLLVVIKYLDNRPRMPNGRPS